MKPYKRSLRIAHLIQREIALMLQYKRDELSLQHVTVTNVIVSDDLKYAKVLFSMLQSDSIKQISTILNENARVFQQQVASKLKLRNTPKLRFSYDESLINSYKLANLIETAKVSQQEE